VNLHDRDYSYGRKNHHDNGDDGCSPFNTKKLIAYLVIVFPLVTGFLLPAKVLDASIADKKGGLAVLSNQKAEKKQEEEAGPNNNQQEDPVINEDLVDLSRLEDNVFTNEDIRAGMGCGRSWRGPARNRAQHVPARYLP
jgi:putative membrane protein